MTHRIYILIEQSAGWSWMSDSAEMERPTPISTPADAPIEQVAATIAQALAAAGYTGEPVAMLVHSASCLATNLSMIGLRASDRTAMLYRLEEHLPLSAEELVADFVTPPADQPDALALGVCVREEPLRATILALEQQGLVIQSIMPSALTAAQALDQLGPPALYQLVMRDLDESADRLNLITIDHHRVTHWAMLSATAEDLALQLKLSAAQSSLQLPIRTINLDDGLLKVIRRVAGDQVQAEQNTPLALAARFASQVLRGDVRPWIEFRRDALAPIDRFNFYRKWVNVCLAAAIFLAAALAATLAVRGYRYHRADADAQARMLASFREHYPSWQIPINIRAVVDAEYRQSRQSDQTSSSGLPGASALVTLHDVLTPMVDAEQFQVERMAFHSNAFEITGRLTSYERIDTLTKIARDAGMVVLPAQTRRDADDTWAFTLRGTRPAPSGSAP